MNDEHDLRHFLRYFSELSGPKVLVHGGGKKATDLSAALGVETRMVAGRRITDEDGLDVVTMVYAGLLNKKIVAGLQACDCNALGLSGADANTILAHKRKGSEIDYGYAGDIDEVGSGVISGFLQAGLTPVFCAITHDKQGQLLNTNADTIASELARALATDYRVDLIYCFEKDGVLEDLNDDSSVVEHMDPEKYREMLNSGLISEGMLPKLKNCLEALEQGVSRVLIGRPELIKDFNRKHTVMTL